ncbi:hypothetical protein [uncultured Erythrobacter sp.]|uniref:hypothetical protein n=1 Tax=uncultured Erythrobacter sp. TaxID=263913 RepID=UPI002603E302|nr:hypothetical protein [uncultured Erythrobacter sp.]
MPSPEKWSQRQQSGLRNQLWRWLPFDRHLGPERLAALTLIYMATVQNVTYELMPPRYQTVDAASVLADIIGLIGLYAISRSSRSYWPLCAVALQGLTIGTHLVRLVIDAERIIGIAYSVLKSGPTLLVMLTILTATILHQIKLRKEGPYQQWRDPDLWEEFENPVARILVEPDPEKTVRIVS